MGEEIIEKTFEGWLNIYALRDSDEVKVGIYKTKEDADLYQQVLGVRIGSAIHIVHKYTPIQTPKEKLLVLFISLLEAYKQSQIYIYDEHSTSADNRTEDMEELGKEIEGFRTEFDSAIKHLRE